MSSTGKHLLALSIVVAGLLTGPALADTPPRLEPLDGPTASIYGPFSYDPSGNIIAIGSTPGSYYVYDPMSRVIGAVVQRGTAVQTQSYAYDVYGNRTAVGGSGAGTYSVNPATNRLTSHGAQYDAAGNLIEWYPPNSVYARQYSFDAGGMLTREHAPGASAVGSVMHIYTPADERYWRFETLADGSNVSHYTIRDLGGKVLRDYLETSWAGFSLEGDYVYRDGLLLASLKASATHHYSLDHLGTPRIVTDQGGAKIAEHTYYPFGTEITDGSPTDGPLKFTGHERSLDVLGETSATLDYMHARFYSANLGRFTSVDPYIDEDLSLGDPQRWNRYSYVMGRPLIYTDPDGENAVAVVVVGGGLVVATAAVLWHTSQMNANAEYREAMTQLAQDLWILMGKRTGRQRDTGLIGLSDEELARRLAQAQGADRLRYIREQKARQQRNKGKSRGGKREPKKPKKKKGGPNKSVTGFDDADSFLFRDFDLYNPLTFDHSLDFSDTGPSFDDFGIDIFTIYSTMDRLSGLRAIACPGGLTCPF